MMELKNIINNGSHATIRINNLIYPGVEVHMGANIRSIDQVYREVRIRDNQSEIIIESI